MVVDEKVLTVQSAAVGDSSRSNWFPPDPVLLGWIGIFTADSFPDNQPPHSETAAPADDLCTLTSAPTEEEVGVRAG